MRYIFPLLILGIAFAACAEEAGQPAPVPTATVEQSAPQPTPIPPTAAPPTPVPATPTASPFTFGPGTQLVGGDIQPRTYRALAPGDFCYWERLSGLGGSFEEIIANGTPSGPTLITVLATDAAFSSEGCGEWSEDLSPLRPDAASPFGDGIYMVGVDIAPGTWQAEGGELCYWAKLSGFSGGFDELVANDAGSTRPIVTIATGDRGFETSGCGQWSRVSE